MKKSLFLFALCPSLCFAQEKEYTGTIIKLCPTAVVPVPFSAIQFAVEQQVSKKFSLQLEFGYGVGIDVGEDSVFAKPRGLKFNTEFRYHFKKGKANLYVGLNAFYRYERRNTFIIYTPYNDSTASFDRVAVKNNSVGLALIFGVQQKKGFFVFNPYIGIGGLYRDIETIHREFNPANGDVHGGPGYHHYYFRDRYLSENSGIMPYFTIGIRLGYAFRKMKTG